AWPEPSGPGEERDPTMSERDEVARSGLHAVCVVAVHRRATELAWKIPVHRYERHRERPQLRERRGVGLVRQRKEETIDGALPEVPDALGVAIGLALGVRDRERVPRRSERTLGAEDDLGHDRIRDIPHDET